MDLLLAQIKAIIDDKLPLVSNLSNVSAILNQLNDINWCGFYLRKDDYLYLGPFQGDPACTIIPLGKGVCGTSALNNQAIVVPNVNEFPTHIACSSLSKSEIVVPIIKDDEVKGVIDIDSPIYNRFKNEDKLLLEQVAALISELF